MIPLALEVRGVAHRHPSMDHDTPAEVSFALAPGGRALLSGANGAGKSTLLRRMVGLAWGEGTIRVGGEEVSRRNLRRVRRACGFLWQNPADGLLLPTPLEDVALGPVNDGMPVAAARELAAGWLAKLGLSRLADRELATLSGGQKQLVALAGILAREPGVLVLDEPAALLDPENAERLASVLDPLPATMVLVTHEPAWWRARPPWAGAHGVELVAGEAGFAEAT